MTWFFWFFWFLLAVAVGVWASNRGRSGFGWWLLALIISPLLAGIFLAVTANLATPAAPSEATHVRCPACAELVLPEATICKHCHGPLTPDRTFAQKRQLGNSIEIGQQEILLVVGFLLAIVIVVGLIVRRFA